MTRIKIHERDHYKDMVHQISWTFESGYESTPISCRKGEMEEAGASSNSFLHRFKAGNLSSKYAFSVLHRDL